MYEKNLFHLQPDFYDRFRCRAAACRHSCCKGWEIDIDENTLDLYRSLKGTWREKMDAAIVFEGSTFETPSAAICARELSSAGTNVSPPR